MYQVFASQITPQSPDQEFSTLCATALEQFGVGRGPASIPYRRGSDGNHSKVC